MLTVIKFGGSILAHGVPDSLIADIAKLNPRETVVVHGGGPEVNELSRRLGVEPRFVVSPDGIRSRYTDSESMEIFVMAMKGKINSEIVMKLLANGVKVAGIAGMDAGTIVAQRKKKLLTVNDKGRKMVIEGGYTGTIQDVSGVLLETMLSSGIMPVVSPIALGTEFEALNIDGDRAAAGIAGKLGTVVLILLTNVDGLLRNGSVVPHLNLEEAQAEIKKVGNGMDKKILAATEAIKAGVDRVVIANGLVDDPVTRALNNVGTVITRD